MYFTYTLILAAGLLVAFPYYLIRFRKYLPTLPDRLGFPSVPQLQGSIWVHAVSVGEVKAVEKLLERLRQRFPGKPLVVSTATPTGQQLARARRDVVDHTFYFPIDLPFCVKRAADRIDPQMVIIAETEIWPNFLRICRKRNIPVVMINGRISDRSFARYRLIRPWLRGVFADYAVLGMQSEMDRKRIEEIGADPRKVTVFGNLKYDVVGSRRELDAELVGLLQGWTQLWIAASTMPGEEEIVLGAFTEVSKVYPSLKLVIAPRHPDRFDVVEKMVKDRGLSCGRRTQPPDSAPQVFILDTIGELAALFEYASVVFMGGSLVPAGGHNVLEPARFRKPIVFGPHMENFRDMARLFIDAGAAIQIQSASELAFTVKTLLANAEHAAELGRRARAIVDQNSGATERVLEYLQPVEAGR